MTAARMRVALQSRRAGLLLALLDRGYAVSAETGGDAPDAMILIEDAPDGASEQALDIRELDDEAVLERVEAERERRQADRAGQWKPWFPVIDYDRCTNCMQCLSFCLFGVYGVSTDGKIQVQNESNCKTECPACSRVCPEVAILFPKYKSGPINGDVVSEADVSREKMKVDISALLGGDIYRTLRERSQSAKSRFSHERDDERALKERRRCLRELKAQLDIPDEVLMSLPSLDDIRRRAESVKQPPSPGET